MGRQEGDMLYYGRMKDREQSNIDQFMSGDSPELQGSTGKPTSMYDKPIGPQKQGILSKGVEVAGDVMSTGIGHFSKAYEDYTSKNQSLFSEASSAGEAVLGGLSILAALPMGAGAAVRQALKNYVPGAETLPTIPGLHAAVIRTALGLPNMLLDPTTRKIMFGNPNKLTAEEKQMGAQMQSDLFRPMSLGEVMETATMFAVPKLTS